MHNDFESWDKASLVQYAYDAQKREAALQTQLRELQMQIDWMQQDQRACLDSYRDLVRRLGVTPASPAP
jgi:cytochrome c556